MAGSIWALSHPGCFGRDMAAASTKGASPAEYFDHFGGILCGNPCLFYSVPDVGGAFRIVICWGPKMHSLAVQIHACRPVLYAFNLCYSDPYNSDNGVDALEPGQHLHYSPLSSPSLAGHSGLAIGKAF